MENPLRDQWLDRILDQPSPNTDDSDYLDHTPLSKLKELRGSSSTPVKTFNKNETSTNRPFNERNPKFQSKAALEKFLNSEEMTVSSEDGSEGSYPDDDDKSVAELSDCSDVPSNVEDPPKTKSNKLMVCRLCLETKAKMFDGVKYNLAYYCEEILNVFLEALEGVPLAVCAVCCALLRRCRTFKLRVERAQTALRALHDRRHLVPITEKRIRTEREETGLVSPYKPVTLQSYNIAPAYVKQNIHVKNEQNESKPNELIQVKDQSEKFLVDKQEDLSNVRKDYDDNNYDNRDIGDNDFDDRDYDMPDDNFSDNEVKIEVSTHAEAMDMKQESDEEAKRDLRRKRVKSSKKGHKLKKKLQKEKVTKKPKKLKKMMYEDTLNWDAWEKIVLTDDEIMEGILKKKDTFSKSWHKLKCGLCFKDYRSQKFYDAHMYNHDPARGELECKFCKCRFHRPCLLKMHMKHHLYRYKCRQCDAIFGTRMAAINHEKFHEGVTYECEMKCGKVFTQASTYMNHLRLNHRSEFVCVGCGENFLATTAAKTHFRKFHQGLTWPEPADPGSAHYCGACALQFLDAAAFEKHLRTSIRHGDGSNIKESPYAEVERRAGARGALRGDDRRAGGTLRASSIKADCPECGESFPSLTAYRAHHKSAHPGVRFRGLGRLMCELCGKKYHSKLGLDQHQLAHYGTKPYACAHCGKDYRFKNNLQNHIRVVHDGQKRYFHCQYCGKQYSKKGAMSSHVKHVHHGVPWPRRDKAKPTHLDNADYLKHYC